MSKDFGILFLHHDFSEVTQNNLASVKKQNPKATLVTMSAGPALRDGYSLEATPEIKKWHAINPQRSSDWLVCSWFLQRREKCAKWWIIEWDVFCTMPAREYYQAVWDFPFVTANVVLQHRTPRWWWFREIQNLPDEYQPFAMGAAPFLYLMDDKVLEAVCEKLVAHPFTAGNGELRFATVANLCGYPPCGFSPPRDYIGWKPWLELPGKHRGIFHPVKFHVDYDAMTVGPPAHRD